MAKRTLREPLRQLETEIIATMIAGHKEWRPDLDYPQSHSDMQGAVRGLLRMFDVKRAALPNTLEYEGDLRDGCSHDWNNKSLPRQCIRCGGFERARQQASGGEEE